MTNVGGEWCITSYVCELGCALGVRFPLCIISSSAIHSTLPLSPSPILPRSSMSTLFFSLSSSLAATVFPPSPLFLPSCGGLLFPLPSSAPPTAGHTDSSAARNSPRRSPPPPLFKTPAQRKPGPAFCHHLTCAHSPLLLILSSRHSHPATLIHSLMRAAICAPVILATASNPCSNLNPNRMSRLTTATTPAAGPSAARLTRRDAYWRQQRRKMLLIARGVTPRPSAARPVIRTAARHEK